MKNIPLFKVYMPKGVEAGLKDILHSGYVAEGENVRGFENQLKQFIGNESVVTTNSCTSALHLALKMCGADAPDSVVLTPSMTCIATNVSIQNIGAKAVWVDVDKEHGMMDPESLRQGLMDRHYSGKIAAVIYVSWGGDLGPVEEIDEVCKESGVKLIVDAAQAFGVMVGNGYKLGDGKIGDYVCFSFQAIKHITTGDGGAMFLRNPKELKRAFELKWFGIDRDGFRTPNGEIDWNADVPEIGFKFHMNNIAGCIGEAQMNDETLQERLKTYSNNDLKLARGLRGIMKRSWGGMSASWLATFLYPHVPELLEFLKGKGIHASQVHVNNDGYSGFRGSGPTTTGLYGTTEFMKRHICLPCGWWVSNEEISCIIEFIKEFDTWRCQDCRSYDIADMEGSIESFCHGRKIFIGTNNRLCGKFEKR